MAPSRSPAAAAASPAPARCNTTRRKSRGSLSHKSFASWPASRGWARTQRSQERLDSLDQNNIGSRRLGSGGLHFFIFFAVIPKLGLLHAREPQKHPSRGLPIPFDHFKLPSADDVAAAILGQRARHTFQIFAHSRTIVNIQINDKIGWHLYPQNSELTTHLLPPRLSKYATMSCKSFSGSVFSSYFGINDSRLLSTDLSLSFSKRCNCSRVSNICSVKLSSFRTTPWNFCPRSSTTITLSYSCENSFMASEMPCARRRLGSRTESTV